MTEQTVPTPGAHLADQGSTPLAPAAGAGRDREPTRAEEVFGAPPVDIFEDEDSLVVLADLPGIAPEGLDVRVEQRVLLLHRFRVGAPALRQPQSQHRLGELDHQRPRVDDRQRQPELRPDQSVTLQLKAGACHLFHPADGRTIWPKA